VIESARLTLRGWQAMDAALHNAMCGDPVVSRYLGPAPTLAESRDVVMRQQALLDRLGHCFWVIERRADGAFLGWCGIKPGPEGTPIAGAPELGWSVTRTAWGQGYASEAARAALDWAWAATEWPSLYAITVPANTASQSVMLRLGMAQVADGDFDHPALADGDPLRRHLTYRIDRR